MGHPVDQGHEAGPGEGSGQWGGGDRTTLLSGSGLYQFRAEGGLIHIQNWGTG